jgi:farnesol dehydrogenase
VLLTGGTGFLGKNVARRLIAAGHELRILARTDSDRRGLPAGAQIVVGDVTDAASLHRAAQGSHAIVHMAALVKTWLRDTSRFDAVNVGGFTNALAAAREAGARLVYTSSFIAVGPTTDAPADETRVHDLARFRNDYERTKALADVRARQAASEGADIVILYPGVVYGPGEMTDANIVVRMVRDHLTGKLGAIIGPGDRLWSYAFADDVAQAHVAALERGRRGERYFLGGDNKTLNEVFSIVEDLSSHPSPRWHVPYPAAQAMGLMLSGWAKISGRTPPLTHREVAVFREHWAYASAKAQSELGYRVTPLREGLGATLDWLRTGRVTPAAA